MKCIRCCGDGKDALGNPCTACDAGKKLFVTSVSPWIPMQYQGNRYSASALPLFMNDWAKEMEEIRDGIVARSDTKNYLICSPYRTGKTVWAYDLLESLAQTGYQVVAISDLLDIKRMMYSFKEDDVTLLSQIYSVPVLVVRVPMIVQHGIVETMQTLLYKRIGNNGQTIFLYSDSYYALADNCGKKETMNSLLGDGSLGSVKLKNYRRVKDDASQN